MPLVMAAKRNYVESLLTLLSVVASYWQRILFIATFSALHSECPILKLLFRFARFILCLRVFFQMLLGECFNIL